MKELSMDERVQLLVAPDSERLAYFIEQAKANERVWSLSNEEGFVMVETEEGDCVMVWPDAEFARQWAVEDWDDCEPVSVSLEQFKNQWQPSLCVRKDYRRGVSQYRRRRQVIYSRRVNRAVGLME